MYRSPKTENDVLIMA